VRFYYDTGLFIDYLAHRNPRSGLRSADRRGRSPNDLANDAERLIESVFRNAQHDALTSVLTYYEAEEALFKELFRAATGVSHASTLLVPVARSIVVQIDTVVQRFDITVSDLSVSTVRAQLRERDLDFRGIRAADSLHLATAIQHNADVFISVDQSLLDLNEVFTNSSGVKLRCCDSDGALNLLC